MEKDIYKLELHEHIQIDDGLGIQRVPGGWNYIYSFISPSGKDIKIINVPFSSEFKDKTEQAKKPKSIKERKTEFATELKTTIQGTAFENQIDEVKKFYEYWTEHSTKGKKMKFEMQKTFDVKLRLKTWFNNKKDLFSRETDNGDIDPQLQRRLNR